ncbi:hypothetical protein Thivi_3632 [Thiocystis violascens DSM 198]|uniref:Uncharacterized protein n=2 Tax=Thiocystis violascens TaxID=73141 RepID=I3YER8_THIV6|nr:hypothetical protein Thivi_3632 [Thiocystis violascens DSM 198]
MTACACEIEIFRPGCHVDMSGRSVCFSATDVQAMASAYRPSISRAPLVIGHPETNRPAYGSVASLFVREGRLYAQPGGVDSAFAQAVNAGRYKKVSASFYPPGADANPVPGAFYLRHLGFLGAVPPAVKGMADAVLADCVPRLPGIAFAAPLDFAGWGIANEFPAFAMPDGYQTDAARLALHRRALAYQEAHAGTDYLTAVVRVG